MGAIVEQAMKDLGLSGLPDGVEVCFGKTALVRRIGREAVAAATASTAFGGGRKVPRGHWSCYAYDGGAVVGAPSEQDVARSNFVIYPALVAALRNARDAAAGADLGPQALVRSPLDWDVTGGVLGLDTEGFDRIESVSMSIGGQTASWQYDHIVAQVVQRQIEAADVVLAHYAPHDIALLEKAGHDTSKARWRCTMAAHRIVSPYRNKGLGYAAPLYLATNPWKGLLDVDSEAYAAKDAWVLPRMWELLWSALRSRGQEELYGTDQAIDGIYHHYGVRVHHSVEGVEGVVERASAALETRGFCDFNHAEGQDGVEVPVEDGHVVCGVRQPYAAAFRCLTGSDLDLPRDCGRAAGLVRYLRGDGVDVARRGLKDAYPTRRSLTDNVPQEVKDWHEQVRSHLRRDDYVTNPFGRRWYYGKTKDAVRFLLTSTIMDLYRRQLSRAGVVPINQSLYHLTFTGLDDAEAFLADQPPYLPQITIMQKG